MVSTSLIVGRNSHAYKRTLYNVFFDLSDNNVIKNKISLL